MPALVIGQRQRTHRVANTAVEPALLDLEPTWQVVGESLR